MTTSSPRQPAFRARFANEFIDTVKALPSWNAIEALLDHDTLHRVRHPQTSGWTPLTVDLALCSAAAEVLGVDEMRALGCAHGRRSLASPLFQPVIGIGAKLLRAHPVRGLRIVAKAFGVLYRDVGVLTCVDAPVVALQWTHMPEGAARNRAWLETIAGGFQCMLEEGGVDGVIDVEPAGARAVAFVFRFAER